MAWALWLSVPILTTLTAALWVWWRARPARTLSVVDSLRHHNEYLAALVVPVRGTARAEPAEIRD